MQYIHEISGVKKLKVKINTHDSHRNYKLGDHSNMRFNIFENNDIDFKNQYSFIRIRISFREYFFNINLEN